MVSRAKLNNGTRLDVSIRADMVADASRHRAQRLAFVVPVSVDNGDRQFGAHRDDESPQVKNLFGSKGKLWMRIRPDHPIRVEPGVMHSYLDQPSQPAFRGQLIDIALAYACGNARDEMITPAVLNSFQALAENVEAAPGVDC